MAELRFMKEISFVEVGTRFCDALKSGEQENLIAYWTPECSSKMHNTGFRWAIRRGLTEFKLFTLKLFIGNGTRLPNYPCGGQIFDGHAYGFEDDAAGGWSGN